MYTFNGQTAFKAGNENDMHKRYISFVLCIFCGKIGISRVALLKHRIPNGWKVSLLHMQPACTENTNASRRVLSRTSLFELSVAFCVRLLGSRDLCRRTACCACRKVPRSGRSKCRKCIVRGGRCRCAFQTHEPSNRINAMNVRKRKRERKKGHFIINVPESLCHAVTTWLIMQ